MANLKASFIRGFCCIPFPDLDSFLYSVLGGCGGVGEEYPLKRNRLHMWIAELLAFLLPRLPTPVPFRAKLAMLRQLPLT